MINSPLKKINSSTLVETIMAMLIVTMVFSIASVVMVNISKNSNNSLKTKAYIFTNDIWVKTHSEKQYIDQDFKLDNILVKRTILEYNNSSELFKLTISAYNMQNHKLFEKNELIIIEENNINSYKK